MFSSNKQWNDIVNASRKKTTLGHELHVLQDSDLNSSVLSRTNRPIAALNGVDRDVHVHVARGRF